MDYETKDSNSKEFLSNCDSVSEIILIGQNSESGQHLENSSEENELVEGFVDEMMYNKLLLDPLMLNNHQSFEDKEITMCVKRKRKVKYSPRKKKIRNIAPAPPVKPISLDEEKMIEVDDLTGFNSESCTNDIMDDSITEMVNGILEDCPEEEETEILSHRMTIRTPEERKTRPNIVFSLPALKRSSLSLLDKDAIIKELESGEKQASICKKRKLPKSTVQSIWKNREKIQHSIEKGGFGRKRCRKAQHENIEEKLIEWIETLKSQNVNVNGPQLRAKAQVFVKQMGLTDFRCSAGWLDKFKSRHNIAFKKSFKSERNPGASDRKIALDWATKIWPKQCEGYESENIFNADELGIFYMALPERTPKLKTETCHGGKMAKERFTILLCTNSDGSEKKRPVVVGSLENPSSFLGINRFQNLPVDYYYNSKSWMTKEIFVDWLRRWDEVLRSQTRNVLLILDNSPAHTVSEKFTNIKITFLPPTVSSVLQPLDHGVFSAFRLSYRRLFLDRIIRKFEQRVSNHSFLSILEACSMVRTAWHNTKEELIADCFKKSNLQAIISSLEETIKSSPNKNTDDSIDKAMDEILIQKYISVGVVMPENISLDDYSKIDNNLQVVDYINDTHSPFKFKGERLDTIEDEEEFQNVSIPTAREFQSTLDTLRNYLLISGDACDDEVHHALSVLESFSTKASHRGVQSIERISFQLSANSTVARILSSSQAAQLTGANLLGVQIPITGQNQNGTTVVILDQTLSNQIANIDDGSSGQQNQHNSQHQQFFAYLG